MYTKIRLGKWLWAGLLTLLTIGCADQEELTTDSTTQGSYALVLTVDSQSRQATRTEVVAPENDKRGKQHVTRVQLYIYEETDDRKDFSCVATEDIGWQHLEGTLAGLPTKSQLYEPKYKKFKPGKRYLFLAVGFDDTYTEKDGKVTFEEKNAVEAFGKPETLVKQGERFSTGCFALQTQKPVKLLNHSEPFSGMQIYTTEDIQKQEGRKRPLELHRRVAGLLGYFKGLPQTIEVHGTPHRIAHVKLTLYTEQNQRAPLIPRLPEGFTGKPKDVPDDRYCDFITSPSDETALAVYTIPQQGESNPVFRLAAYALPAAASTEKGISTLNLTFHNKEGVELLRRRILIRPEERPTRSGTGIIDTPLPEGDSPRLHYPIRANSFYRMGTEQRPIDLSGTTTDIIVDIDTVWDEYYGGVLGQDNQPGLSIDPSWGDHPGGALDGEQPQPTPPVNH